MNRPHLSYLDSIRALRGEPRVTFPEGDANYPMTERVVTALRADAILAFGTPEPDTTRFGSNVLTYQEETKSDGPRVEMYRRYERLPGPVLTSYLDDAETMTPVLIQRQRIATPSLPIAQVAGSDIRFDPQGVYWGYKTTTTLQNYASVTRTVDDYANFNFPRLILAATAQQVAFRNGAVKTRINWTTTGGAPARNAFTALAKVQTVVTYYASKAAAEAVSPAIEYAPVFNDLFYDGLFWSANERGVLNDAVTIPAFTTGTQNPTTGYIVEAAVTFAASSPTATAYIALANGTARVVGVDIKPWKYNLWRMEVKKVVLR